MRKHIKILFFSTPLLLLLSCNHQSTPTINLSGSWNFRMDSLDHGIEAKWFEETFTEFVTLPGSMAENGKGKPITLQTQWTGQIVDSSWFTDQRYEPYRKAGNIKIPFWLQPERHYIGAAWYQKKITIPKSWRKKSIELILERPHWETQVWIDGQHMGLKNTLGTAHVYPVINQLTPGEHQLTIRVDNRVKEIDPGMNSHSISDHTQSNWNGIVGDISLRSKPLICIEEVQLYPDIQLKQVLAKIQILNLSGHKHQGSLTIEVEEINPIGKTINRMELELKLKSDTTFTIPFPMGDSVKLWDEFHPHLYLMNLELNSPMGSDRKQVQFGMREFKVNGSRFFINNRPIFLRGTLECAIFPKTGYPATDVEEWRRMLQVCKNHGLNHMRFHSWCPPKAAFIAADELGVYLQVECSSWANSGSSVGDGKPIDDWLYVEAGRILQEYGNHPSFCMMAYGNEPAGQNQVRYLSNFVDQFRSQDNRRVYTGGAGWPYFDSQDFYNHAGPRIQGWGQQLNSIINMTAPQTEFDYSDLIHNISMPYVSHEIGQWCVYPNFKEIVKYTGVLKAKNFEIFKETLDANHLGHLADSFLLASGKLQALCYKADIEAALRTKGFAGFQLLDLHDFPGQGTALVGVLDAFWEEKGYISPTEYRRFCNQTVPLVRMGKHVFLNNEEFKGKLEIAHFGETPLQNAAISWKLVDQSQQVLNHGRFQELNIPIGNGIFIGEITAPLGDISHPKKLTLQVDVAEYSNHWDIWVYPAQTTSINDPSLKIVGALEESTIQFLQNGGKVLLTPLKGSLKPDKGGNIGVGFSSIFWNTAWTRGQKPHTLGILCNPRHPVFQDFPTEFHSSWQWWDAMSHSNAIILDEFTPELEPLVRVIDDWFTNRRLGLLFEVNVGKGKLMVSGIDLLTDLKQRPEAQQLLASIKKYMLSDDFDPKIDLGINKVLDLYQ